MAARLAAFASLGAAVIHFAVVPAHWQEWPVSGLFFGMVAVFQLVWAAAVLARPTTSKLAVGIVANIGVVALWAMSRTAGVPFGPHAGEPEMVQAAGLCALLLEVYVVMGAGWVWYRGREPEPIPGLANGFLLAAVGAVITVAATLGAASGLQHNHHAPAAETGHHGPAVEHGDGHHRDEPAPMAERNLPAKPAPVEVMPAPAERSHNDNSEHHHDAH